MLTVHDFVIANTLEPATIHAPHCLPCQESENGTCTTLPLQTTTGKQLTTSTWNFH
jgi:hypothetical protein